ncbi:hypothetical protein [Spiroplasma monobiae]|uniref:Uncharacterized protein n=1 Tax=Spiroplasma monobiae MQ-1 TaxID=1336748 RepID=A0A2K9LYW4_SPISQ|nr:hypothetical protein [Spiroplasma monobiae]AUM62954.1 hypothetical protein SMONO_v1c07050 [Spiroplasma monobiae MQ-1]
MKKKKIYKILFATISALSILVSFVLVVFFYSKSNSVGIENESNIEETEKPTVTKSDFAKSNIDINFSLDQKIYIINFSKSKYFNINEFKFYFIFEFNKLGPKNNDIKIEYALNDKDNPTEINVIYKCENRIYTWNFKLI